MLLWMECGVHDALYSNGAGACVCVCVYWSLSKTGINLTVQCEIQIVCVFVWILERIDEIDIDIQAFFAIIVCDSAMWYVRNVYQESSVIFFWYCWFYLYIYILDIVLLIKPCFVRHERFNELFSGDEQVWISWSKIQHYSQIY